MRIGLLTSYPPRRCGIGSFAHDLWEGLRRVNGETPPPVVVAMNAPATTGTEYPPEVRFEINRDVLRDYRQAANFVNTSNLDVLCVQHEFGLFGGPAGDMLFELLRRVAIPVVTTLHTVLREPKDHYRKAMNRTIELSAKVAVISQTAARFLREEYDVDADRIIHIAHGTPDYPFLDPNDHKSQFDWAGRDVILTFGLLGPGKGLETALAALAQVAADHPNLLYVILGATHPEVRQREGEKYRLSLQRLVEELGLTDHVVFVNRFVDQNELCEYLLAADVFVTPYPSREQISSGTLTYALAMGKAIVSTNYYYAEELLADGRGLLVPVGEADAMAEAIRSLLADEAERTRVRRRAYAYGRALTWSAIARRYRETFETACAARPRRHLRSVGPTVVTGGVLPELKLDYLITLTDETGILQHATFQTPNWVHGYCSDDNARALIVAIRNQGDSAQWNAARYIGRYLAFLYNAQSESGQFRNFLSYDRRWLEAVGSEECFGRCIWAAGYALRHATHPAHHSIAQQIVERAMPAIPPLEAIRAKSYTLLGLCDYLAVYGGARDARDLATKLAGDLVSAFRTTSDDKWRWFEDELTYGNGNLPYSLFVAAEALGDDACRAVALDSLSFLDGLMWRNGNLSLIGTNGWYRRGQERARFDQQAIDAVAMVRAYEAAHAATGDAEFLKRMRKAFGWFLGDNDTGHPLVDFQTGGCADGLQATGINQNHGAESTLAYLSALSYIQDVQTEEAGVEDSG